MASMVVTWWIVTFCAVCINSGLLENVTYLVDAISATRSVFSCSLGFSALMSASITTISNI